MDKFFKESEFQNWLQESGITNEASAKSYCSYMRSLNTQLNFSEKIDAVSANHYSSVILQILQIISSRGFNVKVKKTPKTVSNWKTGFVAYGEFLVNTYQEIDEFAEKFDNKSILINYDKSYSKTELYKNLTFRLITQDRFSDKIYFPISFIKRIFYKNDCKAYFDQWTNDILDKTVIHLDTGQITLNEIKYIYFDNEDVKIEVKNKHYKIYTKLANNIDKVPFQTKELSMVVLDHSTPMVKILTENYENLLALQKITTDIKSKLGKKKKINRTVLSSVIKELFNDSYLEKIDIGLLKIDLELIARKTDLQFMDRRFNSSKRAS